jgi:hypothetical protein
LVGAANAVDDEDDEEDAEELLKEKKDLAMNWRRSATS